MYRLVVYRNRISLIESEFIAPCTFSKISFFRNVNSVRHGAAVTLTTRTFLSTLSTLVMLAICSPTIEGHKATISVLFQLCLHPKLVHEGVDDIPE